MSRNKPHYIRRWENEKFSQIELKEMAERFRRNLHDRLSKGRKVMSYLIFLVGCGLIAYSIWYWRKEKGKKHTLSELEELKKLKIRLTFLAIGGVILIALGSVL